MDLKPLDRLEEKIRNVVAALDGLRRDNLRLAAELEDARREADGSRSRSPGAVEEKEALGLLREEREAVRARIEKLIHLLEEAP